MINKILLYIFGSTKHILCSHISKNEKCLFNMLYKINADRLILKRITLHFFCLQIFVSLNVQSCPEQLVINYEKNKTVKYSYMQFQVLLDGYNYFRLWQFLVAIAVCWKISGYFFNIMIYQHILIQRFLSSSHSPLKFVYVIILRNDD